LFRITGLESAGFDRFRHPFIRPQTWQISRKTLWCYEITGRKIADA
jgi:hypothetical protein